MRICVCGGETMNVCDPRDPVICLDCETLMLDDSPWLASQIDAESAPHEHAGLWPNERHSMPQVPAGYPTILIPEFAEEASSGIKKCR